MKTPLPILFLAMLFTACTERKKNPKDPVAGREIIELEDGKGYILKSEDHQTPQIEISISNGFFGIAQLSSDGTGMPPITVMSKDGVIEVSWEWIENGNEIIVTDEDGDGLADYRMIIPQDRSTGNPVRIEDIAYQFSARKPKTQIKGEPDTPEPPAPAGQSK